MLRTLPQRLARLLSVGLLLSLGACSLNLNKTWSERMQSQHAALGQAIPMPDESQIRTQDFQWTASRPEGERSIPARLFWPAGSAEAQALPLVVFSHGLGGSREGYSYLGKYWAANGFAVLHLQHVGSDLSIWSGPTLELVARLKTAAQPAEALARVRDVRFAIDRALDKQTLPIKIDPKRVVVAGHSYGANTSLLIAGATPVFEGQALNLQDKRVRAAIIISAPPFYGHDDFSPILQNVRLPSIHITSTGDEITVPGYHSDASDRIRVFDACGSAQKSLLVFKDGSHSMFTDRLNTGGSELNPQVKLATREATLEFLLQTLDMPPPSLTLVNWPQRYQPIIARLSRSHNSLLAAPS